MLLRTWVFIISIISCTFHVSGEVRLDDDPHDTRFVGPLLEVPSITPYLYVVGIVRTMNTLVGTGVVTGKFWVLTSGQAAKAVNDTLGNFDYFVRSDSLDISPSSMSARTRRIIATVIHPQYTSNKKLKNIGLLKVCPYFSPSIRAPLGQPSYITAGQKGMVMGWGGSGNLKKLRYLNQTIDSDATCNSTTSVVNNINNKVYEAQNFCVVITPGNATCIGDNGSPFIISGRVVGILDQYTCNDVNYADTYTELFDYITWINSESAKN